MSDSKIVKFSQLYKCIASHQNAMVNLIPSENVMSSVARAALSDTLGQRYVFPGGELATHDWPSTDRLGELLGKVESLVQDAFGARFSSVRPLSGLHCMTIVLSFMKQRGVETVFVVPKRFGGHGNTSRVARRLGLKVAYLPMCHDTHDIDIVALQEMLPKNRRTVAFYIDQWVSLVVPSVGRLRDIVGTVCHIHHDTSHIMGLIAGKVFDRPLEIGADSFGGSVHKTFPGPQKGILLWNNHKFTSSIEEEIATFTSHPHTGAIAALGIAVEEFQSFGSEYARRVLSNARCFATELSECGLNVLGRQFGFTKTHQVVCELKDKSSLNELGRCFRQNMICLNFLEEGILSSKNPVRFGLQEVTLKGMREPEIKVLAQAVAEIVLSNGSPNIDTAKLVALEDECLNHAFCS